MALHDWFKKRSVLQLAIARGLKPGGDLTEELRHLGDYAVTSPADAEAICVALERIVDGAALVSDRITSPLNALAGLFQDVPDAECAAFSILCDRGCALLVQLVDAGLRDAKRFSKDDLLFVLKILAMYGTEEGTDAVVRAARQPLDPDGYMWSVILQAYQEAHPHFERLFQSLSAPLPEGFIAVSFLDAANRLRTEGSAFPHPFDSPDGKQRLQRWLADADPEHYSYAHSATAALPFISNPERDQLLFLAMDHPSTPVQLEAAWAAAKLGRDAGFQCLVRYCLDESHSATVQHYLRELSREDLIPADAMSDEFQARAELAHWLAHPNELGRAPDEVTLVDHRELSWPPEGERKPFWLLKYRVRNASVLEDDDVGIGLVGSITFCFFSIDFEQRPPEDCYAIHCFWEMAAKKLISDEAVDEGSGEYDGMLQQWTGGPLAEPKIIHVAELSPTLSYPQRLIALASARLAGDDGWVVLDGSRSAWYPRSDMPAETSPKNVLEVHVGRELLGFRDRPDRKKYLKAPHAGPSPKQIMEAYDRLLEEARTGSMRQREKLLCDSSLIGNRFEAYVEARGKATGASEVTIIAETYERILVAAEVLPPALRDKAIDVFTALGQNFERYVAALIQLDRRSDVVALVKRFEPQWDHNLGYCKLATAAYKARADDLTEHFCKKLRANLKEWHRCEEMGFLAEIWHRRGRTADAKTLLATCLRELVSASQRAKGSDRKQFEDWFQNHRRSYLQLFPTEGDAELKAEAIPGTTVSRG